MRCGLRILWLRSCNRFLIFLMLPCFAGQCFFWGWPGKMVLSMPSIIRVQIEPGNVRLFAGVKLSACFVSPGFSRFLSFSFWLSPKRNKKPKTRPERSAHSGHPAPPQVQRRTHFAVFRRDTAVCVYRNNWMTMAWASFILAWLTGKSALRNYSGVQPRFMFIRF